MRVMPAGMVLSDNPQYYTNGKNAMDILDYGCLGEVDAVRSCEIV